MQDVAATKKSRWTYPQLTAAMRREGWEYMQQGVYEKDGKKVYLWTWENGREAWMDYAERREVPKVE